MPDRPGAASPGRTAPAAVEPTWAGPGQDQLSAFRLGRDPAGVGRRERVAVVGGNGSGK